MPDLLTVWGGKFVPKQSNRNPDYLGRVDIITYIGTNQDKNRVVRATGMGICKYEKVVAKKNAL